MIDKAEQDILVPDLLAAEDRWANVLEVGVGVPDMKGNLITSLLAPGDIAYVMAHGRELVRLNSAGLGEDIFTASELDVMCKAELVKEEDKEEIVDVKIVPLGMFVEIEKVEPPKPSVLIVESKAVPPTVAVVKSVGVGWKDFFGNEVKHQVKPGDKIVFDPYKAMVLDLAPLGIKEKRYLILHGDIWGKVEE